MAVIEYFYSAHSAFAYLGSAALYDVCRRQGATLLHRPIILSPVVEAQGSLPFHARTQAHVDYFFGREIERWAEHRGVDIVSHRPTFHDADYAVASGMIVALGETGPKIDRLAHRLLEAHWRDDVDLSDTPTLEDIAAELGHDPKLLLAQAANEEIQRTLKDNTDRARDIHIFGSPTYIVDGDPFYGQDRLELVAHALAKPFAASNWKNPKVNAP